MAISEINLVLELVEKGADAVEIETNLLWSLDDLLQARADHRFQNDDRLISPSASNGIVGLYPACLNMMGASTDIASREAIAQTSHFLLFGSLRLGEKGTACFETNCASTDTTP
jgi:hypothetical protein